MHEFKIKAYIKQAGIIFGLLFIIQCFQTALELMLRNIINHPDPQIRTCLISLVIFPILGLGLWLIARPTPSQLGLHWVELSRKQKAFTTAIGAIVLLLLVTTLFLFPDMLLVNLVAAILFPVFEELLFRGWIWSRLELLVSQKHSGWVTWLVTTALFAIWHLGYFATVMQNAEPSASFIETMFFKVVVGGAVGFLAGLARWRSGSVYGAIFVHGLWNLFGK